MAQPATLANECERLYAQSLQALTDERQATLKVFVLHKYVKKLRRKGRIFEQARIDTGDTVTKSLEAYAKASCRQLCDEVFNKFPREVRDMIYGYLHPRTQMHIRVKNGHSNYFTSPSASDWMFPVTPASPQIIWWAIDYVGKYFRREMSEHYYRSVLILFDDDFDLLSKFRVTDQWQLGFIPADVINNIGVHIDCGRYSFDGLEDLSHLDPWGTAGDVWDASGREERSVLLANLEQLFGFKKGSKISIKFSVDDAGKEGTTLEVQQWMCDTVLTFVRPSLERLASTGCSIRIILARKDGPAPYVQDYGDRDFVFKSKTFEQDTIQTSFDLFKAKQIKWEELEREAAENEDDMTDVDESSEEDGDGDGG